MTTVTVPGLTDGTAYWFEVTASNAAVSLVGPGPESDPSTPVTPLAGAQAATTVVPPLATGTATTDPGTGPTSTTPVTTSVTVPATSGGGSVAIVTTTPPVGPPPVAGYQVLSQQVDITSTAGTNSANPLTIAFTVDESALRLQLGLLPTDAVTTDMVVISRTESGVSATVPDCVTTTLPLQLDPCVATRQFVTINGVETIQVTVLTGSASLWNTLVKPVPITVHDSGYSPFLATVNQGGVVQWKFAGSRAHTVTDLLALGPSKAPWFASGAVLAGSYGHVFQAAGTYVYRSTAGKDGVLFLGVVTVPINVAPSSGTTATTFTIAWSSAPISGYVFDVQSSFEKAGTTKWTAWKPWRTGTSAASASFLPTLGAGAYEFISRVRNVSTGAVSGWSLGAAVSAH
jgi:plastocyanin